MGIKIGDYVRLYYDKEYIYLIKVVDIKLFSNNLGFKGYIISAPEDIALVGQLRGWFSCYSKCKKLNKKERDKLMVDML